MVKKWVPPRPPCVCYFCRKKEKKDKDKNKKEKEEKKERCVYDYCFLD
jgi:hypothetical protein